MRDREQAGSVRIVVTGEGRQAIRGFIAQGTMRVLNAGVCGGIFRGLKTGMVVFPTRLKWGDEAEITLPGEGLLTLRTVDQPVLSADAKAALDADVIDMEAYHQAEVLQRLNIPFSCLKIVADTMETDPDPAVVYASCREAMRELTISVENAVKNLVNCI